jgi:predicted metalloprotease with PDZ domain
MTMPRTARIAVVILLLGVAPALAQAPVEYRLSFPQPEHRWMQVEVTFREVPSAPLEIRMSRSSPGRYALHEFAKNVFDVRIRDGKGSQPAVTRPNPHQWTVTGHDGTVVVSYRVFGDRVDGTYLAVDHTHAHMNMPATLMWARGLESRPARVRLEQPPGRSWRVATQLYPTPDPLTFTAPNLQYLMDSPTEFSDFTLREFTVEGPGGARPTFRIALHHDGSDADADAYARDVERIVCETLAIFGAFPQFENNTYTFIADYLPWAAGDGMEHRNSTILTSAGALRNPQQRLGLLGTVAHEFVHAWNVERIRSGALEPFNYEDANMSAELWFGEGFTSYYDDVILQRSGLVPLDATLASLAATINAVRLSPGRQFRSAAEMSQLAPFVDAAVSIDRTAWENTFISYYTWGAALGLAFDLGIRDHANSQRTLDTFMQAMWTRFGLPGQKTPGLVATTYTTGDLQATLGELTTRAFADGFFTNYVLGHDVVDYAPLLARAGLVLRPRNAGGVLLRGAALGFQGGGARVTSATLFDSALYRAGVDRDDLLVSMDDVNLTSQEALDGVLARHKPGDRVALRFVRRSGETVNTTLTLEEDPRLEIVTAESTGAALTAEQRQFRERWLGSRAAAAK